LLGLPQVELFRHNRQFSIENCSNGFLFQPKPDEPEPKGLTVRVLPPPDGETLLGGPLSPSLRKGSGIGDAAPPRAPEVFS
jgi:hypothetical protein